MQKTNNDPDFACCGYGCLIFILFPFILKYPVLLVYIAIIIIIHYIISILKEEKLAKEAELSRIENEFASVFPYVAEQYNSVMKELNQKGKNFLVYKRNIINIFQKDKELFFKLKELEAEGEKYTKLIEDLNHSLSISKKEDKNIVF